MKYLCIIVSGFILFSCGEKKVDYQAFKQSQDYNVPLWEEPAGEKIALFIFPHADDEIICAGTMHQLKMNGWKIGLLTLTSGAEKDRSTRSAEWKNATTKMDLDFADLKSLPTYSWKEIEKDQAAFWYENLDSVEQVINEAIMRYKPLVLFTFDTVFGGYGHPEHRMSALATYHVFRDHQNDSLFPVKRIFHVTFPEKMEQLMLAHLRSYQREKTKTGYPSLPDPTIAFDISKSWTYKRNAARCYTSQKKNLRKFYQWPEDKDTMIHYSTFDREYYFEVVK